MGGRSPNYKPTSKDFQGNPTRMMEADFRRGYKAKCRREYDMFLDTDGTRSKFLAYRAVHGGMIVSHTIEHENCSDTNIRMINWYFRRGKSTPVPLVVWAGNAKTGFPEGSRDPAMVEMTPNLMQRRYMTTGVWQKPRVKRPFSFPQPITRNTH